MHDWKRRGSLRAVDKWLGCWISCGGPSSFAGAHAQIPQGSNVSSCQGHAVSPGEVFVVEGAVFEAAVEDPDEAVSQGS